MLKSIKLIKDYTHAVKAIKLVREYAEEVHRDNLEQISDFYDSIFDAYSGFLVAKAITSEAGLYYLLKILNNEERN